MQIANVTITAYFPATRRDITTFMPFLCEPLVLIKTSKSEWHWWAEKEETKGHAAGPWRVMDLLEFVAWPLNGGLIGLLTGALRNCPSLGFCSASWNQRILSVPGLHSILSKIFSPHPITHLFAWGPLGNLTRPNSITHARSLGLMTKTRMLF